MVRFCNEFINDAEEGTVAAFNEIHECIAGWRKNVRTIFGWIEHDLRNEFE